jgi:deoxynucleoside kinase
MTQNPDELPFTVLVEGNIGSGKSTLLNYFSQFPNVHELKEPVEQWQNVNGNNLLQLLYDGLQCFNLMYN